MELGPFQKEWVEYLKSNPKKQGKSALGRLDREGEPIHMCCLGAGIYVYRKHCNIPQTRSDDNLTDEPDKPTKSSPASSGFLTYSYNKLGLRTPGGEFTTEVELASGIKYVSLAEMNDCGVLWSIIAKFIEENPALVFTKSV